MFDHFSKHYTTNLYLSHSRYVLREICKDSSYNFPIIYSDYFYDDNVCQGGGCYHTVRDMTDDWREFTNKSDLNSGGLEIINTDVVWSQYVLLEPEDDNRNNNIDDI